MKIRKDFVTNSSSSSFIIAKHEDCTEDMLREILSPIKKELIKYLKSNYKYLDDLPEELDDAIKNNDDKKIEKYGLDYFTEELFAATIGETTIVINGWEISAGECNNESDSLLSCYLYDGSLQIDNPYFKVG